MITNEFFDGKYKILKTLGKGGMGTVYLAENIKLGTLWAIKQIDKKAEAHIDFLTEANILKKLQHPYLPRIFDILEDESSVYCIMDYIEGVPLDQEILRVGAFPEPLVIVWVKQICDVLKYLHGMKPHPIIYRDMKPANIMLTQEGSIKLIDFGIAREFKAQGDSDTIYIGTRGYAAPEQYGTGQSDAATDIYSLGVTMYHLLTCKNPNEPPYEIQPIRSIDKNLSIGMECIIKKCTRHDPKERYQSISALLYALDHIEDIQEQQSDKQKGQGASFTLPEDYKKVVGICGASSEGTSTMIVALCEYFVKHRKRVAILDLTQNHRLFDMLGCAHLKNEEAQGTFPKSSLELLSEGKLAPIKLNKYTQIFSANKSVEVATDRMIDWVDWVKREQEIVLIDMDFHTDETVIKYIDNLYIVKDMNMYTLKDTASYLQGLKTKLVDLSKIKIILNKFVRTAIKPDTLIDTVTASNEKGVEAENKFLTPNRPQYFRVPFEMENYMQSIENIGMPMFTCQGYTKAFNDAIAGIARSIYPVNGHSASKGYLKRLFSKA